MISDTLFDAAQDIRRYLTDPTFAECYGEADRSDCMSLVALMDDLRHRIERPRPSLLLEPPASGPLKPLHLHPRQQIVARAQFDLSSAVTNFIGSHRELTYAELLRMLSEQVTTWASYAIKDERAEASGQGSPDGETPQADVLDPIRARLFAR